jgi:hypothetical protein
MEFDQWAFRLHRDDWRTPSYSQLRKWFAPEFAKFLSKSRIIPPKTSSTCFCALVIHEAKGFMYPYNIGECPRSCWEWEYKLERIFTAKVVKVTQRKILDKMSLLGNNYAYRRYIKNRPITSWISHIAETIIWDEFGSLKGLQDGFTYPNLSSFSDGWKHRVDFTPGIRHLSYLQIRSMVSPHGLDGLPVEDPSERLDKSLDVVRALEVPEGSGSQNSSSTTPPSFESGSRSLPALPGLGDDLPLLDVPSGPEYRWRPSLTSSTSLLTDAKSGPLSSAPGQDDHSQRTLAPRDLGDDLRPHLVPSDAEGNSRSSFTWLDLGNNSQPPLSAPGQGDRSQSLIAPPAQEDSSQPLLVSPEAETDSQLQSSDIRRQESTISSQGFGPNDEHIFTLPRAPGTPATDRSNAAYNHYAGLGDRAVRRNQERHLRLQQQTEGQESVSQTRRRGASKWMRCIRRWFKRITCPRKNIWNNPTSPSAPRSTGSQGEPTQINPTGTLLPARSPEQGGTMRPLSIATAQADGVSDNAGETTTNVAGEDTETKAAEENTADAASGGAEASVGECSLDTDVRSIETRATARTDFVRAKDSVVWGNNIPGYGNPFVSLRVMNAAENSIDAGVGGSDTRAAKRSIDVSVERPKTSRGSLPPYGPRHGNHFLERNTRCVKNSADDPDWVETSFCENSADTGVGATESIAAQEATNSADRGIERSPAEEMTEVPIGRLVLSQTPSFNSLSGFIDFADAGVEIIEKSAAEEATDAAGGSIERNAAEDPANISIRRLVLPQTPNFGGFAESIALSGFSFVTNIETRPAETTTEDTSVEAVTAADEIITELVDESAVDGANEISDAIAITTPGEEQFNETSPAGPSVAFHFPTPHDATNSRPAITLDEIEAMIDKYAERSVENSDDIAGRVSEHASNNANVSANESAISSAHEHANDQCNVTGRRSTASGFHEHVDANDGRSAGSNAGIITFIAPIGDRNDENTPLFPAQNQHEPPSQLERFRRVWARQDKRPFSLAWMRKK